MYLSCGFYFRQERRIACYAENEQEAEKWLWYPYIPFDKVTLLQGDPGDGKSKLMLSIAALLSNGEPLPFTDEEETEPMTIIYQTTYDNISCL